MQFVRFAQIWFSGGMHVEKRNQRDGLWKVEFNVLAQAYQHGLVGRLSLRIQLGR